MNQIVDENGNATIIIPEVVEKAEATPFQINPDEPQTEAGPRPDWMNKIVRCQFRRAKKFRKAKRLLIEAYNILLEDIDTINEEFGTDFSFERVVEEFGGEPVIVDDDV